MLIVAHDPLVRERVGELIGHIPHVRTVGEATTGSEAVEAIESLTPELVLLDIDLPDMSGFDVVHAISPERRPPVIFLHASDEFALEAFEVHALDYIVKPFTNRRFEAAIDRAAERRRPEMFLSSDERLTPAADVRQDRPRHPEQIAVKIGSRYVFYRLDDIDWAEAAGNYVRAHFGAKSVLLRKSVTELLRLLDPGRFLRIHRSTLVNIERVQAIEPVSRGEYLLVLSSGVKLTTSRSYRASVQRLVQFTGSIGETPL